MHLGPRGAVDNEEFTYRSYVHAVTVDGRRDMSIKNEEQEKEPASGQAGATHLRLKLLDALLPLLDKCGLRVDLRVQLLLLSSPVVVNQTGVLIILVIHSFTTAKGPGALYPDRLLLFGNGDFLAALERAQHGLEILCQLLLLHLALAGLLRAATVKLPQLL